ncbi:MAG: two-component regulator propeller domain-containing protein [Rikenellaceae bacterium]
MNIRNNIITLFFLLITFVADGANLLNVRLIEDIPFGDATDICEDTRGYIWIATANGLYRYDGYSYRTYQIGAEENSLNNNMIQSISEDSRGDIWVGTYGQNISRIDVENDRVTNYSLRDIYSQNSKFSEITSIEVDGDDNIWIGCQSEVVKLTINRDNFEIEKSSLYTVANPGGYITKIHTDRLGSVWIGCNDILKRVVGEREGELVCVEYPYYCHDISDYNDSSIAISGTEIVILTKIGDVYASNILMRLDNEVAYYIACVDEREIWFGGRNGVKRIEPDKREAWRITAQYDKSNLPFEASTNVISSMFVSQQRQVWVATRGDGVWSISENQKPFNNHPHLRSKGGIPKGIVKSLVEDSDQRLWVGTEDRGIYVLRGDSIIKNITIHSHDNRASAMLQTGDGETTRPVMWVGKGPSTALVAIDVESLSIIPQRVKFPNMSLVLSLAKSDDNTLWVGTYDSGLWRFEISDRGEIVQYRQFTTYNSSLESDMVRSLYFSKGGELLVGTNFGVNRLKKGDLLSDSPKFLRSLSDGSRVAFLRRYINQITETKGGDMLFSTIGHGLLWYNKGCDTLRSVTTRDGVADNAIKSVIEDSNSGDVWLATNRGLSRYSLSSGAVVNYGKSDGLQDCEFTEACGVVRMSGEIVFGNRIGYLAFEPQKIKKSNVTPKLYFTDLYINHKRVEIGGDSSILDRAFEYTSKLDLEYDERNFSIGFVGLNFSAAYENIYQIKLEGLDDKWREIRGRDYIAQYTNVPEGEYTFKVRVANGDEVWSDQILTLDITISPPFYRSTIACIIYLLLIGLIIYTIYLLLHRKQQLFVAKVEREKMEAITNYKLDFFMNVSHEFRTPLTLINIPLDRVLRRVDDAELAADLAEMRYNVDQLMTLINQLLEFGKIESDNERVNLQCVDVVGYVRSLYEHFNLLAETQNISYKFGTTEKSISAQIDIDMFGKVVVNLLSNAFKHTPSNNKIEISIDRRGEDRVGVSIYNSGCGVHPDDIPHLVERFYQARNNQGVGSGIGLALCKSIIELHGGTMHFESELDRYFVCHIELPISESEYVAELTEEPCKPRTEDRSVLVKHNKKQATILIVEDNETLRAQLRRELQGEYNIITAKDGEEGIAKTLESLPSLVITDIVMPKMGGIEMCRQIKANEAVSHTPIMVLTANSTVKNQIDSFTIGGADGYLEKPFNMEIFRGKIETILRNREIMKAQFKRQSIVNPEEIANSPADLKCLNQIIKIIKANIGNADLSMEQIATEYGVSRIYLNQKIKAITGETSSQFLRSIRLKYAAKLLLQKQMSVSEIACVVGYNDVATFRSRFKKMFGVLPTQYAGEEAASSGYMVDEEEKI